MEGEYWPPIDAASITYDMQKVIHLLGKIRVVNKIKPKSAYKYARRVIGRLNEEEEKPEVQKKSPKNGTMEVSRLSHNREEHINPILDWLMLQYIYNV